MKTRAVAMRDGFYFVMATLVLIGLTAMLLYGFDQSVASLAPTETVTRFERTIDGRAVQCTRREDHVRGTVEVAC
jgi:hypothetical protein